MQKYGDYSDLICLVKNVDPVKPIAKRYFIEDLGSKDDFDFNDIVVDVIQDPDGNHWASFPKAGEVPMIIAFDTLVDWQKERVSLPEDWWVVPAATEEEE